MGKYEKEIYRIIKESRAHPTVDQIFNALRVRYPGVVLATVYNNLNRMHDAEKIRKISVKGMPDRYDVTLKHDHLVCRRCGKLVNTSFNDLTEFLRGSVGDDFLSYDLMVYFICPACKEQEREAEA